LVCAARNKPHNGNFFSAAHTAITYKFKKVIAKSICSCKSEVGHNAPPLIVDITLALFGVKVNRILQNILYILEKFEVNAVCGQNMGK
jgi:hypothetical protein